MATVWTAIASLCPAARPVATLGDITNAVPSVSTTFVAGDTLEASDLNQIGARNDLAGALGGGGIYCVQTGLEVTISSGITISVSAGKFVGDGECELSTATTLALTNNVYNWVYINNSGGLVAATSATTTVPAVPSGGKAFLARVLTAAGAITEIDYSGRLESKGGAVWRKTYDAGVPSDTPPSTVRFISESRNGLYYWDHTQWLAMGAGEVGTPYIIASGTTYVLPVGREHDTWGGTLVVNGTVVVDGRWRVSA